MRKINLYKDTVKKYETKEIVALADKSLATAIRAFDQAINEQNYAKMAACVPMVGQVEAMLHELNEKLNGKNGPTVIQ